MTIARLFAEGNGEIFNYPGWNICQGTALLVINFNCVGAYAECTGNANFGSLDVSGATVSGYSLSAESEGLTIVDNLTIEFLQLSHSSTTTA